jgi:hypothetical protein
MSAPSTDEQLREVRRRREEISREGVDKARRWLLIASTIGFFAWITGNVPTHVELLGIEFSNFKKWPLFVTWSLILLYLLVQFVAARVDWNKKVAPLDREARDLLRSSQSEQMDPSDEILSETGLRYPKLRLARRETINTLIRLFETWFPAILAIGAAMSLLVSAAIDFVTNQ